MTLQLFTDILEKKFYNNIDVTFEEYEQIVNGIIDLCMCDYYQPIYDCIYKYLKEYVQKCKTLSSLNNVNIVVEYIKCFTTYYDYYTTLTPIESLALQLIEERRREIKKEIHNRILDLTIVFYNFDETYVLADIISRDVNYENNFLDTVEQILKIKNKMIYSY